MLKILPKFFDLLIDLPRHAKKLIVLSVDSSLCVFTVWLAFYLRLGKFVTLLDGQIASVILSISLAIPIFFLFGLYNFISRYIGKGSLLQVARAVLVYGLLYASILTAIGIDGVPRTIGIIQPILLLLFVGASRGLARYWLGESQGKIFHKTSRPRALIYGAGISGRQLAEAMKDSSELNVVGFLDDNKLIHGRVLKVSPFGEPSTSKFWWAQTE